jgi:predicted nucleotidyltransferase
VHPAIIRHQADISAICQRYRIQRLEVFGSAARGNDFDPLSSDADFLVEFFADARTGLAGFFGARSELEAVLGRPVDLVQLSAVRNPYVLESINRSRELVYAA